MDLRRHSAKTKCRKTFIRIRTWRRNPGVYWRPGVY